MKWTRWIWMICWNSFHLRMVYLCSVRTIKVEELLVISCVFCLVSRSCCYWKALCSHWRLLYYLRMVMHFWYCVNWRSMSTLWCFRSLMLSGMLILRTSMMYVGVCSRLGILCLLVELSRVCCLSLSFWVVFRLSFRKWKRARIRFHKQIWILGIILYFLLYLLHSRPGMSVYSHLLRFYRHCSSHSLCLVVNKTLVVPDGHLHNLNQFRWMTRMCGNFWRHYHLPVMKSNIACWWLSSEIKSLKS